MPGLLQYQPWHRRLGTSKSAMLSSTVAHNKLLLHISWQTRLLFFLSNAPYIGVVLYLFCLIVQRASRQVHYQSTCQSPNAHFAGALLLTLASLAYHFVQLFGLETCAPWVRYRELLLLRLDILVSNAYGLLLFSCFGWQVVVKFILPALCMIGASVSKRRGKYYTYTALHGTWHVWSAYVLWLLASHNIN